jgi:hypothetical protein
LSDPPLPIASLEMHECLSFFDREFLWLSSSRRRCFTALTFHTLSGGGCRSERMKGPHHENRVTVVSWRCHKLAPSLRPSKGINEMVRRGVGLRLGNLNEEDHRHAHRIDRYRFGQDHLSLGYTGRTQQDSAAYEVLVGQRSSRAYHFRAGSCQKSLRISSFPRPQGAPLSKTAFN